MMANAVAWIGQDGNLWYKNSEGTSNWGAASNYQFVDGGITALNRDTPLGQGAGFAPNVDRIDDPVAQSPAPAVTGGGSGGTLNQAGIDNTQRTIDEIPALLRAALEAERTRYENTRREFAEQEAGQRKTYDTSTTTNQLNYDSNFMDSIRAGIKGLGGLMSLLRGTGAGGGTAEDVARDTVGGVTAQDIRGGADTQKENQSSLDAALGNFLTELGRKRAQNEDTFTNNQRAVHRDSDTQLQDLFGKMAGFYGDAGDEANATSWMNRAGELTPRIAENSRTQVSPYDTSPVAVQAPQLTAFAPPSQPSVVTAPGGQVGSGIFTMSDSRRRREPSLAGA